MRILFASHQGQPVGGISVSTEILLNSSLNDSIQLSFVETSQGGMAYNERGLWKLQNVFNAAGNIARFTIALVRERPDLVHIATTYNPSFAKNSVMVLVARLFGKKVVLQPHCSLARFLPAAGSLSRAYTLFILRRCQGLAVLSKEWLELAPLIPGCAVQLVPNAINVRAYQDMPRPKVEPSPVNILFLGHIGRQKGIFDLIQAVSLLRAQPHPDFVVFLLGESLAHGEIEEVEQAVRQLELGDTIRLLPPEYGEQKLKRLAAADIYVLPSHHEGLPLSILEAMASGLPVVATRVGGIPDLVSDGQTGLLVDPEDLRSLAEALARLVEDPSLRLSLGLKARQVVQGCFDIEHRVSDWIGFYTAIINA